MADARKYFFEEACKKFKLNSRDINRDLGTNSMYFRDIILHYIWLKIMKILSKMFNGRNAYGYQTKGDADLTANVEAFSKFFDDYTAYLSRLPDPWVSF